VCGSDILGGQIRKEKQFSCTKNSIPLGRIDFSKMGKGGHDGKLAKRRTDRVRQKPKPAG